jgi:hypothetical protein
MLQLLALEGPVTIIQTMEAMLHQQGTVSIAMAMARHSVVLEVAELPELFN